MEKVLTKAAIIIRDKFKRKQVKIGASLNWFNNNTLNDIQKCREVADITSSKKFKNMV